MSTTHVSSGQRGFKIHAGQAIQAFGPRNPRGFWWELELPTSESGRLSSAHCLLLLCVWLTVWLLFFARLQESLRETSKSCSTLNHANVYRDPRTLGKPDPPKKGCPRMDAPSPRQRFSVELLSCTGSGCSEGFLRCPEERLALARSDEMMLGWL